MTPTSSGYVPATAMQLGRLPFQRGDRMPPEFVARRRGKGPQQYARRWKADGTGHGRHIKEAQ